MLASSDPGTTPPIENTVAEPELVLDDWMTAPFDTSVPETELLRED